MQTLQCKQISSIFAHENMKKIDTKKYYTLALFFSHPACPQCPKSPIQAENDQASVTPYLISHWYLLTAPIRYILH